jgi:RNA polymerase sigma-70 factor, ECF subfamily
MRPPIGEDPASDDLSLVVRITSGTGAEEASRRLVGKYWRLLVAWIRPRLRNPSEAEDVAQETWIRAFRAIHRLEDPRRFLGWLLKIARNQAADQVRRHREVRSLDALSQDGDPPIDVPHEDDAADRIDRAEEVQAVLGAVDRLPEKYRLVVLLKHFQGLSGTEMAAALGEPEGTVRNRLFRAHEKIRRSLDRAPARPAGGRGFPDMTVER